jgi:hypothetical protein
MAGSLIKITPGYPATWTFGPRTFSGRGVTIGSISDVDGSWTFKDVKVTGSLTLNGVALTGDQTVVGTVQASVDVDAGQDVNATRDVTAGRNLAVTGTSTFTGLAKLPAASFHSFCELGADASGGATHITATGVKIGDKVIMVSDVTTHASQAAKFEATVTVNDQIQQLNTNLTGSTLVILVLAQS